MNQFNIHHLVKANIDLGMKLKAFTSSNCSYVTNFTSNTSSGYPCATNFMSKKTKSDIQLLLLPPITNFIQLIPLRYNFYEK